MFEDGHNFFKGLILFRSIKNSNCYPLSCCAAGRNIRQQQKQHQHGRAASMRKRMSYFQCMRVMFIFLRYVYVEFAGNFSTRKSRVLQAKLRGKVCEVRRRREREREGEAQVTVVTKTNEPLGPTTVSSRTAAAAANTTIATAAAATTTNRTCCTIHFIITFVRTVYLIKQFWTGSAPPVRTIVFKKIDTVLYKKTNGFIQGTVLQQQKQQQQQEQEQQEDT